MAFFFFCFFSFFKKAKAHCQKSLLRSPKSDPIRSFSWRRLSYLLFCPVWSQRRRRYSAPPTQLLTVRVLSKGPRPVTLPVVPGAVIYSWEIWLMEWIQDCVPIRYNWRLK
jgi:hypothetical protein